MVEVQLAQHETYHLSFWAMWAVEVLQQIPKRFGQPSSEELEAWLATHLQVTPATARSIRRSLEYFWREEWEAATAIAVPRIETVARALVLLLDAPAYRLQRAERPAQYPGLGALLQILADGGLPESWFRYLNVALTHVAGDNLRNEFAHGFIDDPDPATAVIACHALLYLALLPLTVPPPQAAAS